MKIIKIEKQAYFDNLYIAQKFYEIHSKPTKIIQNMEKYYFFYKKKIPLLL